jgi:hypothetical protein
MKKNINYLTTKKLTPLLLSVSLWAHSIDELTNSSITQRIDESINH